MENTIVTTTRKPGKSAEILAKTTAEKLGLKFVRRESFSVENLRKIFNAENILTVKNNSLVLETLNGEFFFHPGIAHLRIKNLRNGEDDRFVAAAEIVPGTKILDCTLGLGSDAIVESFATGAAGKVIALESNPIVAEIVRHGLKNFSGDSPHILEAMRRIEVITTDHFEYLKNAETNSFDVVYFDPMFERPLTKSSGINPLRSLADNRRLNPEIVKEARRVAKKLVVMKGNSGSGEFERLGFKIAAGGKYSPISFGVCNSAAD